MISQIPFTHYSELTNNHLVGCAALHPPYNCESRINTQEYLHAEALFSWVVLADCAILGALFPRLYNMLSNELEIQVEEGVSILRRGGIVAYPTDTVYGLGASASLPQAVARIYQVKKRPATMAFPLLLASISQINDVAVNVPPLAWFLAAKFLPGALTIVLYRSICVSDAVTGGSPRVGVRVPAHPVPVALIKGIGAPLIGTSANLSGQPSAQTAGEVARQIGGEVDFIIDGGHVPGGIESTVVDVTGEIPLILRRGAISPEDLEQATRSFDPDLKFSLNGRNGL